MKNEKTKLSEQEISELRDTVLKAISPLSPTSKERKYQVGSARTRAGNRLPPYYFVYFLLVELLKFPHLGRGEKVAWSIPVDCDGSLAFIEHRKLGLGVFSAAAEDQEEIAARIVEDI